MDTPVSAAPKAGSNKVAWLVAIVVLVGVIVTLNNVGKKSDDASLAVDKSDAVEEKTGEDVIATEPAATAKVVVSNDADLVLPYTAAYTKYGSRRIQFSSACQASPVSATFKDGTKIMLDNRGSVSQRIVVGDQAFKIPAYNFSFVTLTADTLPATLSVSCGTKSDIATITVK